MEKNIFRYILRYSAKDQFLLFLLIISFQPLYLLSLELPKIIINSLKNAEIGNLQPPPYDIALFGVEALTFPIDSSLLNFLFILSFMYLFIVLFTGAQKYAINVYIGLVGERILRRLRYTLYQRVLRFPLKHFRKVGDGAIIPMITQEVEPVGGFAGSAFADPLFQGGQLVIAISYIIYQDWLLGVAALSFYPVQIIIIPKLQKVVNGLSKERVSNVRTLSDTLGASIRGAKQIHANNTSPLELARFSHRIGVIFSIRYKIYRWKFFIKFLNNFIDKLTPFFFFSIGGWLAIEGRLDIGALFAALNAYKDVAAPWKEMLRWYQTKEDVRIKYEQVTEQFEPADLQSIEKLTDAPIKGDIGKIALRNVGLIGDDGQQILRDINLEISATGSYAIVGDSASSKSDLALLLTGLVPPTSGKVFLGGKEMREYTESYLGRRLAYADNEPFLLNGSLYDNMVYGISNYCVSQGEFDDLVEAQKSGNSENNIAGDWVDLASYGLDSRESLELRISKLCEAVELQDYLLEVGLREVLPFGDGSMYEDILLARKGLNDYLLRTAEGVDLVVPFATDSFNEHASVLENLIFGSITDTGASSLIMHPYVIETVRRANLYDRFLESGVKIMSIIDEIFTDLSDGHKLYQRFSFVTSDDLPIYKRILAHIDSAGGVNNLEVAERNILFSLPFHLVPKQHRLGITDANFCAGILEARKLFRKDLPTELADKIHFYDPERYNESADIRENILFGKIAADRPNAVQTISTILDKFISENEKLWKVIISTGLQSHVGLRGDRLNSAQKSKLILVRALLKGADILILDNILSNLDGDRQPIILQNIMSLQEGRGLILVTGNGELAENMADIIFMQGADIKRVDNFSSLSGDSDSAIL